MGHSKFVPISNCDMSKVLFSTEIATLLSIDRPWLLRMRMRGVDGISIIYFQMKFGKIFTESNHEPNPNSGHLLIIMQKVERFL